MQPSLPAPNTLLGIQSKFTDWYPTQDTTWSEIMDWIGNDEQFLCASIPAGSGKSVLAILTAILSGRRTVILTATKALQTQIMADFGAIPGVVDIRGRNAYRCNQIDDGTTCDLGECSDGYVCPLRKDGGCAYFDALNLALASPVVVTNYAYLLAQLTYSSGLGEISLLVCDEAHLMFDALSTHATFELEHTEVESLGRKLVEHQTWAEWQTWAHKLYPLVKQDLDRIEAQKSAGNSKAQARAIRRAYKQRETLAGELQTIMKSPSNWAWEETKDGFLFAPVNVHYLAEEIYEQADKTMLMSAILSNKTAQVLGVDDPQWLYAPCQFPPQNTPIIHIPTGRLNHRATEITLQAWVSRIDQIVSRRQDRKGIIFTVSYDRMNYVKRNSEYKDIMYTHGRGDVVQQVTRFRNCPAPAVLVSPTVTTGWDLPEADYIIVGKLPYPDTRGSVMQARIAQDADWPAYLALDVLQQESSRGTRSVVDMCEVLIIDDSWKWFWPKYRKFACPWFIDRVRGSVQGVPDPPRRCMT